MNNNHFMQRRVEILFMRRPDKQLGLDKDLHEKTNNRSSKQTNKQLKTNYSQKNFSCAILFSFKRTVVNCLGGGVAVHRLAIFQMETSMNAGFHSCSTQWSSKDILLCLGSDDCKEPWVCLLWMKRRLSFLSDKIKGNCSTC